MKKLFALLLALCLMCGVVSAVAEEATQEITIGKATFQIPAELEIKSSDDIQVCTEGKGYTLNIAAIDWEEWFGVPVLTDFGAGQVTNVELWYGFYSGIDDSTASTIANNHIEADIGMPDGENICYLTSGDDTATTVSLGHSYGNYGFWIFLNAEGCADQQELLEVCKEIALSFRLEAPEATQEITLGKATFQIPAELEITSTSNAQVVTKGEGYQLSVSAIDWEEALGTPILTDTGLGQGMNVYLWYYTSGVDGSTAEMVANNHIEADIGMPDGENICYVTTSDDNQTVVSLGHSYGNYGFWISLIAEGRADQQALLDMCKEIALSFRLDGMTAEEMTAAAEEAARIAAEQAAPQQYVVITNSSANIRSGPGGDYAKIITARQSDAFPLIGEDGNWYIIDVNGQTGYVTKGLSAIQ